MGRASQVAQATCAHALSPSPPLRCACLLCSFQPPASLPPGASRHFPPLHTPRAMEREIVGEVRVNKMPLHPTQGRRGAPWYHPGLAMTTSPLHAQRLPTIATLIGALSGAPAVGWASGRGRPALTRSPTERGPLRRDDRALTGVIATPCQTSPASSALSGVPQTPRGAYTSLSLLAGGRPTTPA